MRACLTARRVQSAAFRADRAFLVAAVSVVFIVGCGDARAPGHDASPATDASACIGSECEWIESLDLGDGGEDDAGAQTDGSLDVADATVDDGLIEPPRIDASLADAPPEASAPVFPTPTCATVNQRLRDDFGIVIRPGTLAFEGLASEDIGCADRIKVYEMFRLPFQYLRYEARINPADAFTLHLYRSSAPSSGRCSAYVPGSQAIQIRDLSQCLRVVSGPSDTDFIRIAMFLIHESGHIITARHPALRTAFQSANLAAADPRCYDRGFLKTYSLRSTNPVNESFAEAVALFIGRRKVGPLGTINDFAMECPNTHAWVRTNVFGTRR